MFITEVPCYPDCSSCASLSQRYTIIVLLLVKHQKGFSYPKILLLALETWAGIAKTSRVGQLAMNRTRGSCKFYSTVPEVWWCQCATEHMSIFVLKRVLPKENNDHTASVQPLWLHQNSSGHLALASPKLKHRSTQGSHATIYIIHPGRGRSADDNLTAVTQTKCFKSGFN